MKDSPNYYSILPAEVRYSKDLNFRQKVLYSEITSLTNKTGKCFASNAFFSELYNCHEVTISKDISAIAEAGFIEVFVDRNDGNKREIYITTLLAIQSIPLSHTTKTPLSHTTNSYNRLNNTSTNNNAREEIKGNEIKIEDSKELEETAENLAKHMGVDPHVNHQMYRLVFSLCVKHLHDLQSFRDRCNAYFLYKDRIDEKIHKPKGFCGTAENDFQDGGFAQMDWIKLAKNVGIDLRTEEQKNEALEKYRNHKIA